MPTVSNVSVVPDTVQADGVFEVNVTVNPDVALAESGMVEAVNGCEAGPVNEIDWLAFCTVRTNDCMTLPEPFVAVKVTICVPTVPEAGVPERLALPVPPGKVTLIGNVPPVNEIDGVGVPVAVTLKAPALKMVNVVVVELVNAGGTSVAVGVTFTAAETMLLPTALVENTVHEYCTPLTIGSAKVPTEIGDVEALPVRVV